MKKPRKGFLTDFERDVLLMDLLDGMRSLMNHLGVDQALGYDIDEQSVRSRKMAREYPDRVCMRHQCDNTATWWDFDVFLDGRGYCDEHRPELPSDV